MPEVTLSLEIHSVDRAWWARSTDGVGLFAAGDTLAALFTSIGESVDMCADELELTSDASRTI